MWHEVEAKHRQWPLLNVTVHTWMVIHSINSDFTLIRSEDVIFDTGGILKMV